MINEFEKLATKETIEDLTDEYHIIENKLKMARKQEEEVSKELRIHLDKLTGVQESIKILEDKMDSTCSKLQTLNQTV